jgi:hypothetical protein
MYYYGSSFYLRSSCEIRSLVGYDTSVEFSEHRFVLKQLPNPPLCRYNLNRQSQRSATVPLFMSVNS